MTDLVVLHPEEVADYGPLARLEQARAYLAEASTIDEVKEVRDRAEAVRLYVKQAGYGLEMQNRCAELKLRAERRAGELLQQMRERGERAERGSPGMKSRDVTSLGDLGVSKMQSSRWQQVASLPDEVFEGHLHKTVEAEAELTTVGLLKVARELRRQEAIEVRAAGEVAAIEGTYTTIVADPPWKYDNRATRAAAEDHYHTLTIPELCALDVDGKPVSERAAGDAHLYLWTTNAFLRDAFDVMEAWGFTYKTTLVWVKPQMGIGNYFRSSHEFVLFGLHGRLPVKDSNQMSWFEAPRGRHSRKPDCFYDLVETVSPGPYLEMFARTDLLGPRPGWTPWGNEA